MLILFHAVLSETITVDGKLRPGLPPRRMLWDILKPQASAVSYVYYSTALSNGRLNGAVDSSVYKIYAKVMHYVCTDM